MPLAFLFIGLVLVVAASRNKISDLTTLLKGDFSGKNNFFYWLAGLTAVGSLGYVDSLKTFSRAFLGLVLLSMILANKGFFANLTSALSNVQAPPAPSEADVGTVSSDSPTNANTPSSNAPAAGAAAVSGQSNSFLGMLGTIDQATSDPLGFAQGVITGLLP